MQNAKSNELYKVFLKNADKIEIAKYKMRLGTKYLNIMYHHFKDRIMRW